MLSLIEVIFLYPEMTSETEDCIIEIPGYKSGQIT